MVLLLAVSGIMLAGVLSIGDELLIGKIVNTNSQYISKKLNDIGVKVTCQYSISDDKSEIVEALKLMREKVEVIICTGGLGVTDDDMSKSVISEYFGRELIIGDIAKNDVENWYRERELAMPKIAQSFMELPSGSRYLKNTTGIAPGAIIEEEDVKVVLLPGPPREMKPMLDIVLNYLSANLPLKFNTIYLKTFGIKEADLFLKIEDLIHRYSRKIQITTYCETLEVTVAVRYSSKVSKMELDNVMFELNMRLKEFIYAEDNLRLEEVLFNFLTLRGMKLAVAESLTGGEICTRLISLSGASKFFYEGIVCYDNKSKIERLGVSENTLDLKGAVSEDTAYEMAAGLLEKTGTDIVIATTGIAGPDGGTKDKPVGLVYIAVGTKDAIHIFKNVFGGNREEIRDSAVKTALYQAIKMINNSDSNMEERI